MQKNYTYVFNICKINYVSICKYMHAQRTYLFEKNIYVIYINIHYINLFMDKQLFLMWLYILRSIYITLLYNETIFFYYIAINFSRKVKEINENYQFCKSLFICYYFVLNSILVSHRYIIKKTKTQLLHLHI